MNSNSEVELPAAITSITPQKKNKERYSIFVDETFLIGIANSTLIDHQLTVGMQITHAFFKILQRDEGRNATKSYMLKLLSRRDHARKELFIKAKRKDYPPEIVESVLDELEEKEFINERSFALKFTKDKANVNLWGPFKIRTHLRKKGVGKKIAQETVQQVYNSIDLETRLAKLVKKRERYFMRESDSLKRKKKVINYLLQKGYQPGSIYSHIESLMEIPDK